MVIGNVAVSTDNFNRRMSGATISFITFSNRTLELICCQEDFLSAERIGINGYPLSGSFCFSYEWLIPITSS